MSPSVRRLIAIACLTPAPALAAATPPAAGIYSVTSYVMTATATNGGTCTTGAAGSYVYASYSYPGPGKPGAVSHQVYNGEGGNLIERITYPVTPAADVLTWSGSYTATFQPGGTPSKGSFSSTIALIDPWSFVGNVTYVYPVSASVTCTTQWQESFVRTGK